MFAFVLQSSMDFDKCIVLCIHNSSIIQGIFSIQKNVLCFSYSVPPYPILNP